MEESQAPAFQRSAPGMKRGFATVSSKKAIIVIIGSFSRQIQAQIQHSLMKSNLLKGSVLGRLI